MEEIIGVLDTVNVALHTEETECLQANLKVNDFNQLDYLQLLAAIKGKMSTRRENLVRDAFMRIDVSMDGFVDFEYLKRAFVAAAHPDKMYSNKTEDEILLEFLETFEVHHTERSHQEEDIVTIVEFMTYYDKVHPIYPDDLHFDRMLKNCWRSEKSNKNEYKPVNIFKQEKPSLQVDTDNIVFRKFRDAIKKRGTVTIASLARQFRIADDNNSKTLEYDEFVRACRDFQLNLTKNEMKVLFGLFDRDGNGSINYDEFVISIRGQLNERRKNLVESIYNKLDVDGSGQVDFDDFKLIYNAKNHPKVISGERSEEDVFKEFLKVFEISREGKKADSILTIDEFIEYYSNISASIDSDDYFEQIIKNAWNFDTKVKFENKKFMGKLNEKEKESDPHNTWLKHNFKSKYSGGSVSSNAPFGTEKDEPVKKQSAKDSNEIESGNVLEKLRSKLKKRGSRGIQGMMRMFKIADDNGDGKLSFYEFSKFNRDYRTDMTDEELKQIFSKFDRNKDGSIDYNEFCRGVAGEMNNFRKTLVMKAFRKIDVDGNKMLEVSDLRNVYSSRNHPDVKSGKKTEDDVLAEFLDTFENHFCILEGKRGDSKITVEEFMEYYNNISMSIDNDAYFETMINSAWDLDGSKTKYGKSWRKEI